MAIYNQLKILKSQYNNNLTEIQKEIDSTNSQLDLLRTEIGVFRDLRHKGEYFKNNYTSLLKNESNLQETLDRLTKERENTLTVISVISNKIESM